MNTGNITATAQPISWNEQKPYLRKMVMDVVNSVDASSVEKARQGGLTSNQLNHVQEQLKQMAEQAESLYGKDVDIRDIKVQDYLTTKLSNLISTMVDIAGNQPDTIREAGLSEAVFSHKGSYRPILATNSLATCIGVAGYDPANQFGFVVHFTREDAIEVSGEMLLNRIRAYRENNQAPLLVHLRGGIQGMSEPLLLKVKAWLSSNDLNSIIASEDTLHPPILPGIGIPRVPGSLKLDVRTGTCETYDSSTNPFSKMQGNKDIQELNENSVKKLFLKLLYKKPEITIVYDSKANEI